MCDCGRKARGDWGKHLLNGALAAALAIEAAFLVDLVRRHHG